MTATWALCVAPATAFALEQKTFSRSFPVSGDEVLRLANLAGTIELQPGSGSDVEVEVTVYAENQRLLSGMEWVESRDGSGRPEWALSYPVDDYRGFHYPGSGRKHSEPGIIESLIEGLFGSGRSSSTYRGRKVSIYGSPSGSAPTLFADLTIRMPDSSAVSVRNVVGAIRAENALAGTLIADTGSGSVELAGFRGDLKVDTGSGSVRLGSVRGETVVDTGSGSIVVDDLVGNANLDTGSGSVKVGKAAAGKLRIDTGSGSIKVSGGSVGTLIADTGSGSIQVLGVELEVFEGDTGSGSVTVESPLATTRELRVDTGSGSVRIYGGPDASFDIEARQGSGTLKVGYDDAVLRKRGHKVVGASRGDARTRIRIDTGSGSCVIAPREGE